MVRRPPHTACLGMGRATEQPVEADAAHRSMARRAGPASLSGRGSGPASGAGAGPSRASAAAGSSGSLHGNQSRSLEGTITWAASGSGGEACSTSASTLGPLAIAFCCCHTPAARAARHAWLRPRG
jgi:hypothetical protein